MARRRNRFADEILIDAGQNSQQRALSGSVQTDDADLRAVKVREVDVFEDLFLSMELRHADHGIDDFVGDSGRHGIGL